MQKKPNNLKAILHKQDMSFRDFARRLGMDPSRDRFSHWAKDGYSPKLSTLLKRAEALGMDPIELASELHKEGVENPDSNSWGGGYDHCGDNHRMKIIRGKLAKLDGRSALAKKLKSSLDKLNNRI